MSWLFRAALRLVPPSWRETVRDDLEEEGPTRPGARRDLWCAWQAAALAVRLRVSIGASAMFTDVVYALRSLMHARRFTAGAILTFTVGIGINVAVFSAVDHMLFRKLPYRASEELVQLRVCARPGECSGAFPSAVVLDAPAQLTTIGPIVTAGFSRAFRTGAVGEDERPVRLHAASPGLLRVLGVAPIAGRDMSDEDDRRNTPVALLSYDTWQGRFGGRLDVLGTQFHAPPLAVTVVGVLPRGFVPPTEVSPDPEWDGLFLGREWVAPTERRGAVLAPFARLKPGASLEAVRTEVSALVAALAPELTTSGGDVPRIQVDRLESALYERIGKHAWLIVAASMLIFAMACGNLSILFLVRARMREHQTAVRTALGASRARIVLTSLFETSIVAGAGAVTALAMFALTERAIRALVPPMFGRYMADAGDGRVVGLAILAAFVCALAAGIWPATRAARTAVATGFTSAVAHPVRLRGGRPLLALESALGVVLTVAAVLFVGHFAKLATENLGFEPGHLFRVRSAVMQARFPGVDGYQEALSIVARIPGVVAVGGSDLIPGSGAAPPRGFSSDLAMPGSRHEINSSYFRALGALLVTGREFSPEEVRDRRGVAILSLDGVALGFPGTRPDRVIGRTLALAGELPRVIVGVVPNIRDRYGDVPAPVMYVPLGTARSRYTEFVVRAAPGALSSAALKAELDRALQTRTAVVTPFVELLAPQLRDPRFRAVLLGVLALAGLLLAAGGLYVVTACEAARRTREIGVRLALGASAEQINIRIILDISKPVLAGAAVGLLVAWWASTFVGTMLEGSDPRALWAYAIVLVTLLSTTVLAAWIPARRAARTDPAVVLRAL